MSATTFADEPPTRPDETASLRAEVDRVAVVGRKRLQRKRPPEGELAVRLDAAHRLMVDAGQRPPLRAFAQIARIRGWSAEEFLLWAFEREWS